MNPRTGTATNSIWWCVVCSVVLTAAALVSTTAYLAVTSIGRGTSTGGSPPSDGWRGGRVHFMRDVPKGHDTKPATEIFG